MTQEYKIKGWVARDQCSGDESNLYIGRNKPRLLGEEPFRTWGGFGEFMALPEEMFPNLKWNNDPIEVEITIKQLNHESRTD